jgi:hypothetical protein
MKSLNQDSGPWIGFKLELESDVLWLHLLFITNIIHAIKSAADNLEFKQFF